VIGESNSQRILFAGKNGGFFSKCSGYLLLPKKSIPESVHKAIKTAQRSKMK